LHETQIKSFDDRADLRVAELASINVAAAKALEGIVNLDRRGMLVVSVARRLGWEGPLLANCAAPL
jgi:hypothetical protein